MTTLAELKWQLKPWIKQIIAAGGSSSGPFAPANVPVITAAASSDLTAERVLTAGAIIALTDGGANSTMTVAVDPAKIAWTSGKIAIAVTTGKTLTFAAADDYTITIPATGTAVLGTGTTPRIPYWSNTNTLTDTANMTWDNGNLTVANNSALGSFGIGAYTGANLTGFLCNPSAVGNKYFKMASGGLGSVFYYDNSGKFIIEPISSWGSTGGGTAAIVGDTVGRVGIRMPWTSVTPAANLHVYYTSANTTGTQEIQRIEASSSGTTAATFGGSLTQYAKNAATAASVLVGYIAHTFSEVGATYKSQISHYVTDSVSAAGREALRLYADGVAAITKVIGSLELPYAALSADTTLTSAYWGVDVSCSSANITITLPAAATCAGRVYCIKKVDATAYTVIIDGNASETIDGDLTKIITKQWTSIMVQSTGTGWSIR